MKLNKQTMPRLATFVLSLFLLTTYVVPVTKAEEIDRNFLLSDHELTNYTTMDQKDIKDFLTANHSALKSKFFVTDRDPKPISATELIYRASREHQINPQFLLALIEKEQSLVSNPNPSDRAIDFATGYGCFTGQTCLDRWKGFHKQINSAAAQFRYYIENIDEYAYQPGKTSTICNNRDSSCDSITPANVTTAALYVYTPHLHGNELFRKIWNKFFALGGIYPDGTLLQAADEDGVWLIQNGTRRPFTSKAALVSRYSEDQIIAVNKTDLLNYPEGRPIEFAAYTLVEDETDTIYLLTPSTKRPILSDEVFRTIGFNPEEVEAVTADQIQDIPVGQEVTIDDAYPTGALIQNNQTGGVYYVEGGSKFPLWSREVMIHNYPNLKIFAASPEELDQFDNGEPVPFKDGFLVKDQDHPDVYVISNGNKMKIADEKTFNTLGYRWGNIIVTNSKMLALHPFGGELSI